MYTKVHVALDGSKQSKGAASVGLELAKGIGARLVAVHVDAPSRLESRLERLRSALPVEVLQPEESSATDKNGRVRTGWLADEADDAGISFASERHAGAPHEELLSHMEEAEDDLLVIGSWGQTGDGSKVARLGSVVERFRVGVRPTHWWSRTSPPWR